MTTSCRSIFVVLLLSLVYARNCPAQHTITIDDPPNNQMYADGAKIKPKGSCSYYQTTVKVTVYNVWYVNGQQQSNTVERTFGTAEFGGWEFPEEVTLHGSGYWSVTAVVDGTTVIDQHYGAVSGPPP